MIASTVMQNPPSEDGPELFRSVSRFVATHCVIDRRCASGPRFLHREFRLWSNADCSLGEFLAALEGCGFTVESDGLVGRLAFFEDVEAARHYEREREQTEPGERG